MIYKGLDTEDASFLTYVSGKQAEFHGKRFNEDDSEIQSYRISFSHSLILRMIRTGQTRGRFLVVMKVCGSFFELRIILFFLVLTKTLCDYTFCV